MMYLIMVVLSEFKDACAGCQYSNDRPILSRFYLLSILPLIARLTVHPNTPFFFLFQQYNAHKCKDRFMRNCIANHVLGI